MGKEREGKTEPALAFFLPVLTPTESQRHEHVTTHTHTHTQNTDTKTVAYN